MLPRNQPDRIRIVFDDHRLVANAGLLLPATLARHLGLRELVDHHLDLGGAPGRANTGDKLMTLVASAMAGGDCIDDADVLRTGGTACTLGGTVKAPSTLGTFLRSFRWGHVRQLDRVSRELLARAWAAGAGPGDAPFTIDLDSTICETYGLAKEGARHHGYTGKRGYHPLLAIADRMERKRVIQLGQGAAGLIALFVAVSITTDTVSWVHLFVASLFQGALFSFLIPARQAIIPSLVGRENLNNAMALSSTAMSITTLVAPAAAGVLYARIGPDGVFVIVILMNLAAVAVTGLIGADSRGPTKAGVPMVRDIADGLAYIRGSHLVLILLLMGFATAMLAMPFRFLMPVFVVDIYGRGPEALGLLVSVMGLGSLVGALFIAGMGRWRRGIVLLAGSFLSGVGLILVGLIPLYVAAVGIMIVLGLGDAVRRSLMMALIMEQVSDEYRGRVMSVFMMSFGLMPLGVLPVALVAEFVGAREAAGMLGFLLLLTTALIFATQRQLRELV